MLFKNSRSKLSIKTCSPSGRTAKELRSHQMPRVFATSIGDVPYGVLRSDLMPLLTPQRKERIERLVHTEDVMRALMGERLIRDVIKRELGIQGAAVRIETNAYGKPCLAGSPGFHFNLSHSGRWVVCAVGVRPVGIDVEREGEADWEAAASFFSDEEQRDLAAVPAEHRRSHFYRLWTLKESFMKCTGKGFFIDPVSFTIKIEDIGIRLWTRSGAVDPRYRFWAFELDHGYALAGCSEGESFAAEIMRV